VIDRYQRHIVLPQIGIDGQRRLSSARVAVVGAGGLGSPGLFYLASAGVGHLSIIDSDIIDITNLNRQFIHSEDDIGKEKSVSAMEALKRYNSEIDVSAVSITLDEDNARRLLERFDFVLSCVDNTSTRYILNRACIRNRVPLIDGGVEGFGGYVLSVQPGITPCYQCIFPENSLIDKQRDAGVLGAAAGVIGSLMAVVAIKAVLGMQTETFLHYVDLLSYRLAPITVKKSLDCPVCNSW